MEPWILGLLNHLDRERLSGISQLLEPSALIPVGILKDLKPKIIDLVTSNPNFFFDAATLYYAKFIQSIEVANLPSECVLIPQYLKTIEIIKNLSNGEAQGSSINFEPYLTIVVNGIKEVLLSFESIEKTFEFLKILKQIEENFGFLTQKEEFEFVDTAIQEYVENEDDLRKSYSAIIKIKEGWGFDLFYSEGSWITKARQRLEEENKEACDKNLIKDILILFYSFTSEYFPEIKEETASFCEGFEIDPNEIFNTAPFNPEAIEFVLEKSAISSDFSPIFENYFISHKSQFKLKKRPICKQHPHITVWEGIYLLNLKHICVKEYKGNDDAVINQYNREANIIQNLSEIGSSLYLEHYSHFEDGDSHYIVMEFCKNDLREMINKKESLSKSELAHFVYLFIKGLSELKTEEHIYHRDIKPENIMISYDNEFKLIDWNISENFVKPSLEKLGEQSIVGTLEYFSPEKYNCHQNRLPAQKKFEYSRELNDVYSLGLVILELHTLEIIVNLRASEEIFYQKIYEHISKIEIPWLPTLLEKMLEIDWKSRLRFDSLFEMIKSNEEFMKDIQEYVNNK